MLAPEEENEAEVRREDQDNINKFARLNAKLHEVRAEKDALQVGIVLSWIACLLAAGPPITFLPTPHLSMILLYIYICHQLRYNTCISERIGEN
jgi:hypothetical protein